MKRPADYFSETNEFDNGKHAALWKRTLVTCASPIIGSKLITDYTLTDVSSVMEAHWLTKTATMMRLLERIETSCLGPKRVGVAKVITLHAGAGDLKSPYRDSMLEVCRLRVATSKPT